MSRSANPRVLLCQAMLAICLAVTFVQQAFAMGDPDFVETHVISGPIGP